MKNFKLKEIEKEVKEYINRQVNNAEELGFIDNDFFAYCVDEAFLYGNISSIINMVDERVNSEDYELYEDCLEDAICDVIWDNAVYNNPERTFEIFKEHGRANQIPSWYFG